MHEDEEVKLKEEPSLAAASDLLNLLACLKVLLICCRYPPCSQSHKFLQPIEIENTFSYSSRSGAYFVKPYRCTQQTACGGFDRHFLTFILLLLQLGQLFFYVCISEMGHHVEDANWHVKNWVTDTAISVKVAALLRFKEVEAPIS